MVERGLDVVGVDVAELPDSMPAVDDVDLWINRVNVMPSEGRASSVVAATAHLLLSLELAGCNVVNGARVQQIGCSKTAQMALFTRLGLATPAGVAIASAAAAPDAAQQLGFPVLTKPNVGGSGVGIVRFDDSTQLEAAVAGGEIDLGIDGTGLVQRYVESADGLVHRVEMLGAALFYATAQPLQAGAFNYCAADGCASDGAGEGIELVAPPVEIIEQATTIMAAASADVGGVEYLIDQTTGQPSFYDFNPYSNFVSDIDGELGFDPLDRYIDHVLEAGLMDTSKMARG